MTPPVRILGAREVTRRIRAELADRWPGVRFIVRGGRAEWRNWVMVGWTDGPPDAAVRELARRYEAMGTGNDARGPVIYGIHGVLSTREISPNGYGIVADALERRYPLIVPRTGSEIDWSAAYTLHVEPPIDLHGRTFGPLEGTYATTRRGALPLSQAICAVADSADMSELFPEPPGLRSTEIIRELLTSVGSTLPDTRFTIPRRWNSAEFGRFRRTELHRQRHSNAIS
ncbi:LPD29 domain-containing protein [Nocardia terpenica]|uniref:Large polyvalent protein associated domain-containing protein n=1 Tax=Nocardia terpenica TaxID=455432 RepID=A0A291RY83_9NOCA|nr:LPD29 domain-containing protein [Nocardia terpenica]ATL72496.1 hypothetical protein CRH09_39680 [Nocardia terpenica]